jgi:hypothetical protein
MTEVRAENIFKKGDKVRTPYGEIKTVMDAYGCQVKTYGGEWFHPTKVFKVYRAVINGAYKYVTVYQHDN